MTTQAPTLDRRVRRTRDHLFQALLDLILEKGYERVTVQDIIDRADVGRSTFYAHYRDKEELMLSGFEELRPAFEASFSTGESPSLLVFRHAGQYRHIYKAMAGKRGGQIVIRHLRQLLVDLYRESLETRRPLGVRPEVPLEMAVEFLVSALIGTLQWCVDLDDPSTPEELQRMFLTLADPGFEAAFGVGIE